MKSTFTVRIYNTETRCVSYEEKTPAEIVLARQDPANRWFVLPEIMPRWDYVCKNACEAISFSRFVRTYGLQARAIDNCAAGRHKAGDCRYTVVVYNPGLSVVDFWKKLDEIGERFHK